MAAALGAGAQAQEHVQFLIDRYAERTQKPYEEALVFVRPRLGSAYTGAGPLEPAPGPELVTVLQRSRAWRTLLTAAEDDLFRQLPLVRGEEASAPLSRLAFQRTVERDDMPSLDPAASIRLPALLDVAALDSLSRRRVEEALDRQWVRCAAAITTRRTTRDELQLERARLRDEWGAAWELTATNDLVMERQRQLTALHARELAADVQLAGVMREAAMQLLRLLPQAHAAPVRDTVDALLWPDLFAQEKVVKQAVARAIQGADPDLAAAMQGAILLMQQKLEPTRREFTRRAARVEDLQATIADAELGAGVDVTSQALLAHLDLLDLLDRRRRLVRETALSIYRMAHSIHAPQAPMLEECLASIDADARASNWLRQGLQERLDQLTQHAPAEGGDAADDLNEDSP